MKNEHINIVVEGKTDAGIIRQILEHETKLKFNYYIAGGYSSAITMTKTLLLEKQDELTILIVDSDTTREEEINTRKEFLESYLSNRVGQRENFKFILFSPELEAIFFQSKELIETIIGGSISDIEYIIKQSSPKEFIYSKISNKTLIKSLNKELFKEIKKHPKLKELLNFIDEKLAILA